MLRFKCLFNVKVMIQVILGQRQKCKDLHAKLEDLQVVKEEIMKRKP